MAMLFFELATMRTTRLLCKSETCFSGVGGVGAWLRIKLSYERVDRRPEGFRASPVFPDISFKSFCMLSI